MINEILASIDSEISVLKQARALLTGTSNGTHRAAHPAKKRKWTMSAEAREKIAAAQRARWAKQKKAAK
jgi:selenocysteine lyase/cysteine desulfurase